MLDGVRVHRVFGRRGVRGRLGATLFDYAVYSVLAGARLIDAAAPDVVLSLTTPPLLGWMAGAVGRLRGYRGADWIMDLYPDAMAAEGMITAGSPLYAVLARMARRQFARSRLVVTLADEMGERVRAHLRPGTDAGHIRTTPLWALPGMKPWPEGEPNGLRAEYGWATDETVLMYSGNMGLAHRFAEFFAAAEQTAGDGGLRWVFAAGGRRRGDVEAFSAAHPAAKIDILPTAPEERLRQHLCAADVHLISFEPRWRGCVVPSKLQGSFAVGRPVIFVGGADNSIARWLTASGGGWVIEPGDVAALLRAVEQARDPGERTRRGRAALDYADRYFNMGRNAERICEQLEAVGRADTPRVA